MLLIEPWRANSVWTSYVPADGNVSETASSPGRPVRWVEDVCECAEVVAGDDAKPASWLSERVHAPAVVLPFSVGGSPEAKDLFGLFDDTLNKLLAAK